MTIQTKVLKRRLLQFSSRYFSCENILEFFFFSFHLNLGVILFVNVCDWFSKLHKYVWNSESVNTYTKEIKLQ